MGQFYIVITGISYILGNKITQIIWKMDPDAPDFNVCDKCIGTNQSRTSRLYCKYTNARLVDLLNAKNFY